ncbi:MBL fold metallo-hydrolase [Sphaerochaeta halotolerans]|jgi:7,8-dihydropterin-6-yl-methyl-4-(beta-D-ribofuranosyl)aminobenzene 5'-phosphate synthase|uniref:MBL fold metallo-hydrolase n=1 Tax=Sphaerochaeta halotolerans TaxID=2293840 RepID=A0A372MF66_9SPIR|nr:MBL fold metallo-hydrolase [Sphaerochaeta halotolerans]MBG0768004.1 MBL fold metallo-hydrolase [Spirochaetaceae bacterium]MDK2860656.1 7,8-dihydropterin-6-yl-methyl-4-(beta-D-ribofuranosyl)aminobenzene 5-phosphate synthase [Sphaerochaeta sp.]MXI86748.1 MBL fold metallo-hydrolase [Sphaerochaeta halotolerans]RFU94427.1 MBL fold metallo-hydrolase [Sphaerochaeta halotolerans]
MKITTLVENTTRNTNLGSEHGLSLYIEGNQKTMLFDTGASALFADNAEKLGVDLKQVDLAILSHGHYDHGGGIKSFFSLNHTAPLYARKEAFGPFFSERSEGDYHYIGVDQDLLRNNRILFTSALTPVAEGIFLFSKVEGERFIPTGNKSLFKQSGDTYTVDSFTHEQYLAIKEENEHVLVSGCSHRGIVNILDAFHTEFGHYPTRVIGGFHLYNHRTGKPEDPEVLDQIAAILLESKAIFYTCHCTGKENYAYLKEKMGDAIHYLAGGDVLEFPTY